MHFPDISQYPDDQRCAIEEAKVTGGSHFSANNVRYGIVRQYGEFTVNAHTSEDIFIGSAYTSVPGLHYGLKVDPKFRGQGVGKILYSTKVALCGILPYEWSGFYSRISFLIRAGYVPAALARQLADFRKCTPLDEGQLIVVRQSLMEFSGTEVEEMKVQLNKKPALMQLKYAPSQAQAFLQSIISKN